MISTTASSQSLSKSFLNEIVFCDSFNEVDSLLTGNKYSFENSGTNEGNNYVIYKKRLPNFSGYIYVYQRPSVGGKAFDVLVVETNDKFFNELKAEITHSKYFRSIGEEIQTNKFIRRFCDGLSQYNFTIENDINSGKLYSVFFQFSSYECIKR